MSWGKTTKKAVIEGCRACRFFKKYHRGKPLEIECCLGEIHIKTARACNRNKNNKWSKNKTKIVKERYRWIAPGGIERG